MSPFILFAESPTFILRVFPGVQGAYLGFGLALASPVKELTG